MEEYRIDLKVRNNIILYKLEQAGYKTVGEFCRLNGKENYVGALYDVVAMKRSPLDTRGNFLPAIIFLAEKVGCSVEDLFTDAQFNTIIKSNKRIIKVNEAEMKFMLSQEDNLKLLEDQCLDDQMSSSIEQALLTLTPREKKVIEMRMGLGEYSREHTLDEVGEALEGWKRKGTSRERVRQIESKALRKLRHPLRSDKLKEFVHE